MRGAGSRLRWPGRAPAPPAEARPALRLRARSGGRRDCIHRTASRSRTRRSPVSNAVVRQRTPRAGMRAESKRQPDIPRASGLDGSAEPRKAREAIAQHHAKGAGDVVQASGDRVPHRVARRGDPLSQDRHPVAPAGHRVVASRWASERDVARVVADRVHRDHDAPAPARSGVQRHRAAVPPDGRRTARVARVKPARRAVCRCCRCPDETRRAPIASRQASPPDLGRLSPREGGRSTTARRAWLRAGSSSSMRSGPPAARAPASALVARHFSHRLEISTPPGEPGGSRAQIGETTSSDDGEVEIMREPGRDA